MLLAWIHRLLARIRWSHNLVTALAIACVSSLVLASYKAVNPGQGAEHYYMRENKTAYKIMQVCYVVIVASIGFNLRYVAMEILSGTAVLPEASSSPASRSSRPP